MKKIVLCLLFFMSAQARAITSVDVNGELDVTASVWNLPTGERGNSAFEIPSLFLDFNVPLKDDNLLVVQLEGSEEKTASTERFSTKVREAYLDVVSLFQGMKALRLGLIPQTWQEAQYETWSYRYLGSVGWAITEKWKYLTPSDLGVSFMSQFPGERGEWAVTLANGEGAQEKEQGPHKEAAFFARWTAWEPWTLSFNYVRGNYDKYGEDVGLKERIQASAVYRAETWTAGLEYLAAKDPADALRDLHMAEGVDVTALSGESVKGQGASVFAMIRTGPKAEVVVRYDYLNAVTEESGKDLQTALVALGYQVTEDIRAAVMVDYTRYGSEFAPGSRDRSKLAFATQVLF